MATRVSIPFIGSNLFKYWYNVVIKGEKQQFQSPLSGQICLNAAASVAANISLEFQSPLSGQICLNVNTMLNDLRAIYGFNPLYRVKFV